MKAHRSILVSTMDTYARAKTIIMSTNICNAQNPKKGDGFEMTADNPCY